MFHDTNVVLQCGTAFGEIPRAESYGRLVSSTRGRHAMKKLINSPETVVTDALAGMAAPPPPTVGGYREQGRHPRRRADRGEGGPGVGRRLGARAAARRLRRLRHA